ncbi:MAG TPA: hypothetical protein ENO09_00255 [bacterium]|nr:hypothetical protein [bacterium]
MKKLNIISSILSGCTILEPDQWPQGSGEIILTFDDGPSEKISTQLLDVLYKHHVPAVFCYIGKNVSDYPEVANRAIEDGHSIAIHTCSHSIQSLISNNTLDKETDEFIKLIKSLPSGSNADLKLFRPPLGLKTPAIRRLVNNRYFDYAYLTFFINDAYSKPDDAAQIIHKIKCKIKEHDGAAIVFHELRYMDGRDRYEIDKSWLPEAVDELITWAKSEGYVFSTYKKTNKAAVPI